jgi:hypothetical protein
VSLEAKEVTVSLTVTDDLSGVACAFITLSGPGNQLIQNGCATLVSGDSISGRYEAKLTLPRYSQAGVWKINAQFSDLAANHRPELQIGSIRVGS